MIFNVFSQGFALSLGLIVAIGAQNTYVLRQGLRREHVGLVVIFCAGFDALFISAGVLGMAAILGENILLTKGLALVGASFLGVYGWQAWQRARRGESLHTTAQTIAQSKTQVLLHAAAFTVLNPHVYLDTVLLIGSIGAQHPVPEQYGFIAGACLASAVWFFSLGFGAKLLAPIFAKPLAWQIFDSAIALIMWSIAISLLVNFL